MDSRLTSIAGYSLFHHGQVHLLQFDPLIQSNLTFKSRDMKWQMPIPEHMMPEMNVRGRSKLHE
ncbi:MAG: hypothetical protein JSY10_18945 [Paenibacillus sp.]|nr:hypothetical protein [Paenibacillus sp.]